MIAKGGWVMKTFKQMYYEDGHTAVAKTNTAQKRELERLKIKHDREDDRARTQDTARKKINKQKMHHLLQY